jgi:hypothetical protein
VDRYQTIALKTQKDIFDQSRFIGYWAMRMQAYGLVLFPDTIKRFEQSKLESEVVLFAAHQLLAARRLQNRSLTVCCILPQANPADSSYWLYTLSNRTYPGGASTNTYRFIAEGAAVRELHLAPLNQLSVNFSGPVALIQFPDNSATEFWSAFPVYKNAIINWVARAPKGDFAQLLTFDRPGEMSFFVTGTKTAAGTVQKFQIEFLSEEAPVYVTLPAQAVERDEVDAHLESLCQKPSGKPGSPSLRLGKVYGLRNVPREERFAAKILLAQYFAQSQQRAEVDVRVPGKKGDALYTFRFQPGVTPDLTDAVVTRVGNDVADPRLLASDIHGIYGCPLASEGPEALQQWWNHRYPSVPAPSSTLAELEKGMRDALTDGADTPEWFNRNYGIKILSAAQAHDALMKTKQFQPEELVDFKDYTSQELRVLERSLQTLDETSLKLIRGTSMVRQNQLARARPGTPDTVGRTFFLLVNDKPQTKIVSLYDAAHDPDRELFCGGTNHILPRLSLVFLHEFGHITSKYMPVQKRFNKEFDVQHLDPVTWYAAADPEEEFYPEVYALYYADPEWLQFNRTDIYDWMRTFFSPAK